ncbi:hypothetical protein Bbelb_307260 [Branchiostoma belcheri]|nr:hypothetical protein Bbelb_307260 [Branchiostoma belcheri]
MCTCGGSPGGYPGLSGLKTDRESFRPHAKKILCTYLVRTPLLYLVRVPKMNVNVTVPVVLFLLLCLDTFRPAMSACTHHLGRLYPRGQIRSLPDVTSDRCEWDITTLPHRIILGATRNTRQASSHKLMVPRVNRNCMQRSLAVSGAIIWNSIPEDAQCAPSINFDTLGYRRGSENCAADVLTFHDGNSATSRTIDSFCGDQTPSTNSDDVWRLLDLSTASTGHQMYVVYNRNPLAQHRPEFNITFTTRDNNDVPEFNEETFLPQTTPVFNHTTAEDFVQVEFELDLTPNDPFYFPYGYKTNNRNGDFLQLYATIQDYALRTSDLSSDLPYSCKYTADGSTASVLLTVPADRNWSPDDWPWVAARDFDGPSVDSTDGVLIYDISGVKVGEEITVECQITGLVAFTTKLLVTACPIGRFGRFCAERCQCYNGAACHSFNGACRCAPGWTGRNCTTDNPEMHISPPERELTDLRFGQELQLTCTAYKLDVTDITWSFPSGTSVDLLPKSKTSSVLRINSLAPEHEGHVTCEGVTASGDTYTDVVDIRIVCEENYWGPLCDRVCNCTEQETCDRFQGCVCQGEGCPDSLLLIIISLSAGALILLLLGAIFLLYRHNNRLRVGNIDDPEVFQLGQDLKALMPPAAGFSSGSIDMELLKERGIDRSRLQLKQLLGEGAFGHVVKATMIQPEKNDVMVAVKKLKDDDDPQARQALLRETCIMLLCGNHDNVLGLKGICFRDGPLQLVLEYAEHGSLLHLLWTLRAESKLNRTVLVNKRHIFENMMVEVCCGLEHLATRKLVHRDIAARNILICGKGTAKIADFGLARDMYAVGYHRQDRGHDLLPLKWMAPEGLKNDARFTHKSDVWSFGVLLWEVAQLGRTPYPGMEGADRIYDALQNHFRLPRPQLCTEERYQLMLKCWKFNEKTRPDATTVRKLLQADPNGFFYFNAPVAAIETRETPKEKVLKAVKNWILISSIGQAKKQQHSTRKWRGEPWGIPNKYSHDVTNCRPALGGCTHQLTGNRGHIRSGTDVTSNHCEWDITTDSDRIILINFDRGYFERGSDGCTTEVLTFYDGGSENSRVVDTFCRVLDVLGPLALYHLSAASTGHQLHVVLTRRPSAPWWVEQDGFYLTYTTRKIEVEPVFDENTFVPQTEEDFDQRTVAEFVRITVDILILDDQAVWPYGYSTGGDILEFYLTIQENVLDFDLTPGMDYTCWPTHSGTKSYGQLIVKSADGNFPFDDWPWIAFYLYEPWKRTVGILKYTYWNVKVGEENSALNEIVCEMNGQTFPIEITVKACPIGRFGRFCAERCQCYNGAACHSFNGACRCAPGWTGRNCTTVHPEVRISPSDSELNDLRFGQELQLTCTAYNCRVTNFNWFLDGAPVNRSLLASDNSSSVLYIRSLLPEYEGHVTCVAVSAEGVQYTDEVDIRIAGCQDNYWGELCGQVCNCTDQETCNRTLGCVCSGDGCSDPPVSQTVLLATSLSAGALILLLLGAIFLLYRHNNRLRVGNIDDPEVFQLGQDLKALMPPAAGSSSGSIDMELLKEREIDRSRLQLKQLLGEGAFGHVVEATLTQAEEEDVVVAVKKLKDDDDPQARQDLLRETCIMLLCGNHDNVLGLKGICFRDGPLQLVLEYAEHGSLLHLLWTLRAESKLNRTVLVNKRHIFENMMVEVCCGLEHLATRRLVHRDIAARNILICGKGTAKIADFGLARDMYAVGYHRQDKGRDLLPLKWMAPEGLKNEARFTHKSDVWSFGVLLWEVAQLGRTPYPGMEGADRIYDALQNHFRLPRPQLCTEERYQLMLKCWKFNEKTRPDATTVRKLLQADPNGFFYFIAPVATVKAPVTPV